MVDNDEVSFTQEEMRDEVFWEEPKDAAAPAISAVEPGKAAFRKMYVKNMLLLGLPRGSNMSPDVTSYLIL